MKNLTVSVMALMLMVSNASFAQEGAAKDPTAAPGVEKRILKQKKRISKKLQKGKITQTQADQLNSNVDAVKAEQEKLAADGKLTKEERKDLHQKLKKNSDTIKESGTAAPAAAPAGH